jgi:IMP dehydrogenase
MSAVTSMSDDEGVFGGDGYTAQEIFGDKRRSCYAYTYDDIIILPGHVKAVAPDVSLENHITRNIKIKVPLLSSPMDTVTEHEMAIGMALQGAIGIIHYNMTVEEQVHEVQLVKKYKNGFIVNPVTLSPENTIADVDKLKAQHGYSGVPITVDGKMGSTLVGIVCHRDIDFFENRTTKLRDVMTSNVFTGLLYLFFVCGISL